MRAAAAAAGRPLKPDHLEEGGHCLLSSLVSQQVDVVHMHLHGVDLCVHMVSILHKLAHEVKTACPHRFIFK